MTDEHIDAQSQSSNLPSLSAVVFFSEAAKRMVHLPLPATLAEISVQLRRSVQLHAVDR